MPLFGLTVKMSAPTVNASLHLPQSFTDAVEQIPREMQANRHNNMRIYLDTKSLSEGEKYGLIHNWERLYDHCGIHNMENRNDGMRLNDGVFNYMCIKYRFGETSENRLYHLSQDDPFVRKKLFEERNYNVGWVGHLVDPDRLTKELLDKLSIGWVMVNPKFRQAE